MATKKIGAILGTMIALPVFISACLQPYPTTPSTNNGGVSDQTSAFATPLATNDDQDAMAMLESLATGTALAKEGTVFPDATSATPAGTEITPDAMVTPGTPTATLIATVAPTSTNAASGVTTPAATIVPGSRPSTYTLQKGEFPYCIARRYNLNPDELLSLNGITNGTLFMPGLTLTIPQTNSPFPGDRALHIHPTTHTVTTNQENLYAVACYYGDVDPAAIAQANGGMSLSAALTSGQTLQIP